MGLIKIHEQQGKDGIYLNLDSTFHMGLRRVEGAEHKSINFGKYFFI